MAKISKARMCRPISKVPKPLEKRLLKKPKRPGSKKSFLTAVEDGTTVVLKPLVMRPERVV